MARPCQGGFATAAPAMDALKPILLCLAAVVAFAAAEVIQVVTAPRAPQTELVQP